MEDLVLQQGYSRYDCSYEPESNTTEACIRYSVQWLYILHNIIIMYYYDYTFRCSFCADNFADLCSLYRFIEFID